MRKTIIYSNLISTPIELGEFLKKINPNPLERVMASNLLIYGYSFYYQYRIEIPLEWLKIEKQFFIADFYIPSLNLIIETDGKGHFNEFEWKKDIIKNNFYTVCGYSFFRFIWEDVMDTKIDFPLKNYFTFLAKNKHITIKNPSPVIVSSIIPKKKSRLTFQEKFINICKTKNRTIAGCLRGCEIKKNKNNINIYTRYKFHYERLVDQSSYSLLEQIALEVLKKPYGIAIIQN